MDTKICKVCGKKYPVCKDAAIRGYSGAKWQAVACSPECGSEYLRLIEESRKPAIIKETATITEDAVDEDINAQSEFNYEDDTIDYN